MIFADVIPRGQLGLGGAKGEKGDTGAAAAEPIVWPSGAILLWAGTLANIPNGWALCDGTNGTPDLRDKFVKGAAAAANPGTTGGATTHTHDEHAARVHSGLAISDHPALSHSGAAVTNHSIRSLNYKTPFNYVNNGSAHSVTQPSAHSSRSHSVTAPNDHAARTHSTTNHEPSYFKIAYVMKT